MEGQLTKGQKFKRFLKRNLTPTWFGHTAYQVAAFLFAVALLVGVVQYGIMTSYEERKLTFVDGFTITAQSGAFETRENSTEYIKAAISHNCDVIELDVRSRPDGTLVMKSDIAVTNRDGVDLKEALQILKGDDCLVNFNIKETRTLNKLHDMLVEYNLYSRSFLTGIESINVNAIKRSNCKDMEYYLDCRPSRIRIFDTKYQQDLVKTVKKSGAVGINCNYSYASETLSKLMHENGLKLSVFSVKGKRGMLRSLTIHPDNISTREYTKIQSVIKEQLKKNNDK